MTQMNLWSEAKSGKQTQPRNGTPDDEAGKPSEGDKHQRGASEQVNSAVEHPLRSAPEFIAALFGRFQESEEQNKDANEKKAGIFADAKAAGLDAGALRAAFRQRVRELEKPEAAQKHDASNSLTASYLAALRANRSKLGGSLAEDDRSHPVASCEAAQEPLARSRAREEATEVSDSSASNVASSNEVESGLTLSKSLIDDEPEIPDFLKAKAR